MTRDPAGRPLLVPVPELDESVLEGLSADERALVLADLAQAADSAKDAITEGTRETFEWHIRQVQRWADLRAESACPMPPERFAAHLATVRWRADGHGRRVRGTLSHATVLVRVAAVDAWHTANRLPRPGDSPLVKAQIAAAKAASPPPGSRCDPLLVDDLIRMLTVQHAADRPWARARDRLLTVLAADRRLSAARLARLRHDDVEITALGLLVGGGRPVLLARRDDAACPVEAWAALAASRTCASGGDDVFAKDGGGSYTAPGLRDRARVLAGTTGLPMGPSGLPRAGAGVLAAALSVAARPHAAGARDRSLLVAQYLRGLRPGSAGLVRWRHARPVPGHGPRGPVELLVPRSKTDQHGDGTPLILETTATPATSPAGLFWDWVDAAAAELGGDPWELVPDAPLWFPLYVDGSPARDAAGDLPFLSADAVSDIARRLATKAAVGGHITGASLRSGLVTSLCDRGVRPADVRAVSGHADITSLLAYDRPAPGHIGTAARLGL